jgi:hypothetical protein
MKASKNILEQFNKVDIFVENPGNPGTISVISNTDIILYDMIGILTEISIGEPGTELTEVVFFPWGAIKMLRPILAEEDAPNE